MTSMAYSAWIEGLERKLARQRLIFLQLGAAHEPVRRALREANFITVDAEAIRSAAAEELAKVMVVDRVEALVMQRGDVTLGVLRERVLSALDAGSTCILLSRAPRTAYPTVPGSSLLDDASFAHAPNVPPGRFDLWPTCAVDGEESVQVLEKVLRELGSEVCAALDRAVFECLLTGAEAIGVLTAREVEAIEAAGLISSGPQGYVWNFSKPLNELKEGLGEVLAADVQPQAQLGEVSRGLWQVERLLRRTVRSKAIAAWGPNWRQNCVSDFEPREVLKRATEAAYPAANSIKLIRDPLEWLTLGQLMELRKRKEIGGLGLTDAQWRMLAADVMPIRNRLAHMRTLHPGDSVDVAKWLRVLEVKLSAGDKEVPRGSKA